MRIIFFGTPQLCIPYLNMLNNQHELLAIICNPDQPVGRKQTMTQPPTKQWGLQNGITVLQPEKLKDFDKTISTYAADLFVVVAYGKIIPDVLINVPRYGTLNVHYSLLPRWRGASPVEAAILAGDAVSGVCIQQMRFELDSGPIWAQEELSIGPNDFARTIRDGIMGEIGVRLLSETVVRLQHQSSGNPADLPQEQVGTPTFCYRIRKSDGELLVTDTDITKWRKYRAYYPWPGVFYFDNTGKRIKVNTAQFDNNQFIPTVITAAGETPTQLLY